MNNRKSDKKLTNKESNEKEEAAKNDDASSNNQGGGKAGSTKNIPEFANKIDYDKIPKDELVQRLHECEEKLKMEYEERKKILLKKKTELDDKEKLISSFAKANRKLINEFDALKSEVDMRLDKVNVKAVQKIEKINEDKKNNPLEIVLRVRERELKNNFNMMQVLKRDKDLLEKKLEEKTDYKKVIGLEDSLLNEEKKNQSLQVEIKLLQKMLEDHNKKCVVKVTQNLEKEKFTHNEIKALKDKQRELTHKLKEEDEKHNEIKTKYQELRRDYDKMKNLVPKDVEEREKEKERIQKLNRSINLTSPKNRRSNSQEKLGRLTSGGAGGRSVSKSTQFVRKKLYPEQEHKLFSTTDIQKLNKLLSKVEIDKYEKKFDFADHKTLSLERKYQSDFKVYNKKYNDLEEQLEFITLQLKEAEQRAKIFQFQIHEHKIENKALHKKCIELQGNIEVMQKLVNEKENENKALINKIQEYQGVDEKSKRRINEMEELLKEYRRNELGGEGEEEEGGGEDEGRREGDLPEEGEGEDNHNNIKPQMNKGLDDDDDL